MSIVVGIDLPRTFLRSRSERGRSRRAAPAKVSRQAARLIASLPVRDRMEACSGAHHWRASLSLGHTVRLMAPKFVRALR